MLQPTPNWLRQFTGREHGPVVQFVKYSVAGTIATTVNIGLFYLCALKLLPALNQHDIIAALWHVQVIPVSDVVRARNSFIDNAVAFLFSNLTAYLINIAWVFDSGRHHRVLEILYFYAVSGASMVIGSALMVFLIGRLGVTTTAAFGVSVVVSLVINYVMRKRVIFRG